MSIISHPPDPCKCPVKIIPLGGLGEIGLNMMVFETSDTIMVVDCGLMFPEDYMLGVDIVIPDFEYIKAHHEKVKAIILTHSHEDHIGAVPYLLKEINVPIYATPFTLGLVRHKLEERELLAKSKLVEVRAGQSINIGPFAVEFIQVCHSVADGVGLAINTPAGLIVHTGDFKISHGAEPFAATDTARFAQLGSEGVLALLSDSTNAEKEGYTVSEQEIGNTLADIVANSPGRILVAVFASNIPRIAQIIAIAKKTGRKIVFNGRSIEISVRIAVELGLLTLPQGMEIALSDIGDYPEDQIVIVTTGSQGEPMSALARIATRTHKQLRIQKNDTVILSSKFIPGNEKAITSIINRLYRLGAEVIYEKISQIHVSGHAFREELKLMMQLVRPRYFIPIHGEYRHLVHHARLAKSMGMTKEQVLLAENGDVVCFSPDGGAILDSMDTGRTLVDGKGVGDVGRSVLRERRVLSEHGIVIVTMIIDADTGVVMHGPELTSKGFVFEIEKGHLLQDAQCVILDLVEEANPNDPDRLPKLKKEISQALRQYFGFVIQRRPMILPIIVEV
jgi:ribonuclease J